MSDWVDEQHQRELNADLERHDEPLIVRFNGGPEDGQRKWTRLSLAGWPLPERQGGYVKVHESQLPPQGPTSSILRGAEYEWRPENGQ